MSRSELKLLERLYELGELLNIKDYEIDDFIEENENDYNCDLNKIIRLLETTIAIKEKLGDKYNGCDLNNYYKNYRRWSADDIGVRIYVDNEFGCDVNMIVEENHIEVCDQYRVDDTAEIYHIDEYEDACDYAVNMKNDEEDDEDDEY